MDCECAWYLKKKCVPTQLPTSLVKEPIVEQLVYTNLEELMHILYHTHKL